MKLGVLAQSQREITMGTVEFKLNREDLYVVLRALDTHIRKMDELRENKTDYTATDRAVASVEYEDARRVRTALAVYGL